MMRAGGPGVWEDAVERERRLQFLQLSVVVIACVVAAVLLWVLGRQIVAADARRQDGADQLAALVATREEMRVAAVSFWEHRAQGLGGAPAGALELARLAPAGLRALKAADPDLSPAEAVAADRAIAAADGLGPLLAGAGEELGSVRDLANLTRARAMLDELTGALDRWVLLQRGLVDRAAADARSHTRTLVTVLIGIMSALVAAAGTAWLLIERLRRRLLASVARQAEERGAIIGAMQSGLLAVNRDGFITEVNDRLCEMTGFGRMTLVGSGTPRPFWPPAERGVHEWHVERHLSGEAGEFDVVFCRADGTRFDASVAAAPLFAPDGTPDGYVATISDATDRRAAERELRRNAAEQAALGRVATAVAAFDGPSLDAVFALVAEEIARLFGVEGGRVARFEDGDAVVVGWWNDTSRGAGSRPALDRLPLASSGSAMALVHRTGRPARVDDYAEIDDPTARRLSQTVHAAIAAPVRTGDGLWGAVSAVRTGGEAFPPGAEDDLARFAELVGLSVTNAEARARLAAQATTDPLTGLANHREFHERLADEVARARHHGRDLSVALLDIDRFKETNDAHGHHVGDAVIAEVGRRLAAGVAPGELAARIGGEEFAVILPELAGLEAWRAADALRGAVVEDPFPGVGTLTLSAGVCDLSRATTAEDLVRLADGALYWAKANGRDVAFLYDPQTVREMSAQERANRLERAQALSGLRGLARAVDAKDRDTQQHSERVAEIAVALARRLGWSDEACVLLREAGLVHDVGKIGVPDSVLFKPGPLTPEEYAQVKEHADLGAKMVTDILNEDQVRWVRHHHERVDGTGYPAGLAGDAIPLGARILTVADSWDVMTGSRGYRPARDVEDARRELARCAGSQFDADVVAVMDRMIETGTLPHAAIPAGS